MPLLLSVPVVVVSSCQPGFMDSPGHPPPLSDYALLGKELRVEESIQVGEGDRLVRRVIRTSAGALTDRRRIPRPGGQFGIAPNHICECGSPTPLLRYKPKAEP